MMKLARAKISGYTVFHDKNAPKHYSLHKGLKFLNHAKVNHTPRSYIYTMGILHGQILTWRKKQLVNSSQRYMYVSATLVQRLLSQELVEITILRATCSRFRVVQMHVV